MVERETQRRALDVAIHLPDPHGSAEERHSGNTATIERGNSI
jgi:hypothetical protein